MRPNSGQLYGLSSASKIYVIHPASGTARPVGAAFTPALGGRSFGFDFDPVADQIRAVSDSGQNLRFDPRFERGLAAGEPRDAATVPSGGPPRYSKCDQDATSSLRRGPATLGAVAPTFGHRSGLIPANPHLLIF